MHGLMGTPKLMMNYSDLISKQMQAFLNRVLRKPEELSDHINMYVLSINYQIWINSQNYGSSSSEDLLEQLHWVWFMGMKYQLLPWMDPMIRW